MRCFGRDAKIPLARSARGCQGIVLMLGPCSGWWCRKTPAGGHRRFFKWVRIRRPRCRNRGGACHTTLTCPHSLRISVSVSASIHGRPQRARRGAIRGCGRAGADRAAALSVSPGRAALRSAARPRARRRSRCGRGSSRCRSGSPSGSCAGRTPCPAGSRSARPRGT